MISISKSQVPNYLHNSEFYHSIDDDGGEICIPANCFRSHLTYLSKDDLRQLLSTLRFWGLSTIPAELVKFVIFNKIDDSDAVFAEFEGELVYLSFLRTLSQRTANSAGKANLFTYMESLRRRWRDDTMVNCATLCCLQYEYKNGATWNAETCNLAAQYGTLAMLQWLHEHGCPWDSDTCSGAAAGGQLDCLKYAHENRCPWDVWTCSSAAQKSQLACLKYAHEHDCPWDERTCINAINARSSQCLQYAQDHGCPWSPGLCAEAACKGNLSLLKRLHEGGCPWDGTTCTWAVIGRQFECLKYAHENGCEWDSRTCRLAASCGKLKFLQYAHENGCPWNTDTCTSAAASKLDCLQYAHEHGCPWDISTCASAAFAGQLSTLSYAHASGCPWDLTTPSNAAKNGQVHTLRYAHEHGCPWDIHTTNKAAESGHFCCLVYAHENGCPWNASTCSGAAGSARQGLKCLQYAHSEGCPWDAATCDSAARQGNLDCLKYAHQNGCPWGPSTCTAAVKSGHIDCLKYAHEHGCPLDPALFRYANTAVSRKCIEYAQQVKCYPQLYFSREIDYSTDLSARSSTALSMALYASRCLSSKQVDVTFPPCIEDIAYLSLSISWVPVLCSTEVHDRAPLFPHLTTITWTPASGPCGAVCSVYGLVNGMRGYELRPIVTSNEGTVPQDTGAVNSNELLLEKAKVINEPVAVSTGASRVIATNVVDSAYSVGEPVPLSPITVTQDPLPPPVSFADDTSESAGGDWIPTTRRRDRAGSKIKPGSTQRGKLARDTSKAPVCDVRAAASVTVGAATLHVPAQSTAVAEHSEATAVVQAELSNNNEATQPASSAVSGGQTSTNSVEDGGGWVPVKRLRRYNRNRRK